MTALRVLVVDDEPAGRLAIRQALENRPEAIETSECASGAEAVQLLRRRTADIVFLDVAMPEIDGLDVVRRVGIETMPAVVFVTAHEDFAVTAFELRALDYLLKPFSQARFDESFSRVARILRGERAASPAKEPPSAIRIQTAGRTTLVPLEDVLWFEAARTYVRVHTAGHAHLLRASLSTLEEEFASQGFLRVHRSALVRVDRVRELRRSGANDWELVLDDDQRVPVSRRRREELRRRL